MFYLKIVSHTLLTGCILANIGCAPAVTKPEVGSKGSIVSAEVGKANSAAKEELSATQESKLGNLDQQKKPIAVPSSLDQMKQGKSTASSPSTPLRDIIFEFDRYDLTIDARQILKSNADWLKGQASAQVEVEGHSDERGTSEYNLALAAKRSQLVRDYLVSLGIAAGRITTISYGEEIPACIDANENCWRQNRRVRFVVIPSRSASLDK